MNFRSLVEGRAVYIGNCVGWPQEDVDAPGGLVDMVDSAREISRATFVRAVDPASRLEVEDSLGYGPNFPIQRDWSVRYHSGRLHGRPCYWITQSAIEHVFQEPSQGDPVAEAEGAHVPSFGFDRADLPQVTDLDAMIEKFDLSGIPYHRDYLPASEFVGSQNNFEPGKIDDLQSKETSSKPLFVSQDKQVLDGHHRWATALSAGDWVDVVVLELPFAQALQVLQGFSSC